MSAWLAARSGSFQQAVEADPSFPQAHAALAYSYILLRNSFRLPPDEAFPRARAAALKAQEMDDTLAETQKALISVRWSYERDWLGTDRGLARALEISPSDPDVHGWYAQRLSMLGRHDEAIAESRRACELDPNAVYRGVNVGRSLYRARRYDEAIEQFHGVIERNPDNAPAHSSLSFALVRKGMRTQAIEEAEKGVELSDRGWGPLAYAYAAAGRSEEARKILETRKTLGGEQLMAGGKAAVHTALGEKDLAFAWLDKAYEVYHPWLFQLHDPIWDPLRDDPRFEHLLRRLNNPYRPPAGETTPDKGTAS